MDLNTIKSIIHSLFQGSGGKMLSKQDILSKVTQSDTAKSVLPFFQQIPDKKDYTEDSLNGEVQNIMQKQGGAESIVGKIHKKVGV